MPPMKKKAIFKFVLSDTVTLFVLYTKKLFKTSHK